MSVNISYPTEFCKSLNSALNSIIGGNSNLVPHIWYHKIVYKTGKPDNVRITILAELLNLYITSEGRNREFKIGCAYLQNKFNYTYDQVYEALLKLQTTKLISKKGKLITFNVENVLALSIEQKDTDNDNTPPNKIAVSIDKNTKDSSLHIDLYIDITREDNKVKREEYISGSQFEGKTRTDDPLGGDGNKNVTEQKFSQEQIPADKAQGIIQTAKKWVKGLTRKSLASFYPLTEEDAAALRLSSGREFNLNFINRLVLRLAKKYPGHGFYTKKLFLKYMTEVLARELRQAVNVNNEGFRFKRTDEEGVAEEYLAKVEDGYGTKASDQVRRKIAATFEPIVAYKILTGCYFPEEPLEGRYEIKQRLPLELSRSERERLHSQISAVFGDELESIEIIQNFRTVAKSQQVSTFEKLQAFTCALDTATIWGRLRSSLISLYGEAIDKSWFSRLECTDDTVSRSLVLKGASFLTSYVQTNYSHVLERLCQEENYQLKFC